MQSSEIIREGESSLRRSQLLVDEGEDDTLPMMN